MIRKLIVLGLAVSLVSVVALAADKGGDEISPNGGSDSCGIGWQVTKNKTLIGTLTRGTTNYYLSPAWSMTSGTSGCEKHAIAKRDSETVKYVAANFNSIKADMAEGQGEYLAGLARLMGCNDQGVSSFQNATQKNYQSITRSADAYEALENVKGVISADPSLSGSCSSATI